MASLQRHANAPRLAPQGFQAQAARRELVTVGSLDVPHPEMLAKTKPDRQIQDDVGVGPRLAARGYDALTKLHQRLGFRADLEAKAQRFPLETGGHGHHDVGELGR